MSDNVLAARRRELIAAARAKVAKILAPDTTRVGANVLAEQVLDDLDKALAADAELEQAQEAAAS